jgi:hypothetical protein
MELTDFVILRYYPIYRHSGFTQYVQLFSMFSQCSVISDGYWPSPLDHHKITIRCTDDISQNISSRTQRFRRGVSNRLNFRWYFS